MLPLISLTWNEQSLVLLSRLLAYLMIYLECGEKDITRIAGIS
ncbi:hypothetical protein [Legionella tunisiensis]|nr:hypothetical protein [Legionella tunisiensis]